MQKCQPVIALKDAKKKRYYKCLGVIRKHFECGVKFVA